MLDLDSDNDGVLNTDEYAGAVYNAGGTPFGDADSDGIYNYLDENDVNNPSFSDSNGDGVDDQVDQDLDGIPNFFDLDSDNDGILDAIEANDGIIPVIGSFNATTGRFEGADDGDGLVDAVAAAPLNNDDLDVDGLDDYLDLDSDNDGITDHVEAQLTSSLINPSGLDTDKDGLDDAFDGNNGGTAITPINTDGTDEPDYRDTDSDNDNDGIGEVGDFIEGYDANRNGFSDLDSDSDGDLSDESGYNTDTDGDGLWNIFDNYSGSGVNNILGSKAKLQDTDGDGTLDFRDQDDDADNITTAIEDVDSDGNWTNDKVQGGGATPDYLYFNDSDNDRVADGQDADGDNDGISDLDEYDNVTYLSPFGDADGDGVFNYNDPDNPKAANGTTDLTDSNSDGIWDEYDWDLDGVPNFFDLDSDNDGIADIIEAGGVDTDDNGRLDIPADTDGDGLLDNVDVNSTGGTDANSDGIDDDFQDGFDADSDGIEDTADFDDDGDGVVNIIDSDEGGTPLADPDTDGDSVLNRLDYDSDNDGILDIVEAGGTDFNGDGILDSFGDTDGDGWGNAVDSDNGGTAHPLPNTDSTGGEDYIDLDSEDDGTFDWDEGFDDNEDLTSVDNYIARVAAYNAATSSNNYIAGYLDDSDGDNVPNLLDADNATHYFDADGDGIINLFDIDQSGNFYGNVSGFPDNDGDGTVNVLDGTDIPLPLNFLSFNVNVIDKSRVSLKWTTSDERNVSHFEVLHTLDGKIFQSIGTVQANNKVSLNKYSFIHKNPIKGYNYYKIKEIDFDDHTDYTEVKVVFVDLVEISWSIYPNPTYDWVTISSSINLPEAEIQIINTSGQVIYSYKGEIGERNIELESSNWPSGMYYLQMILPDRREVFPIIKK
jgi:hypothetical protein